MIDFHLEGIGKEFKSKKTNTLALNQIKHTIKNQLQNVCYLIFVELQFLKQNQHQHLKV
jgi:two-component sensor histidine kinase